MNDPHPQSQPRRAFLRTVALGVGGTGVLLAGGAASAAAAAAGEHERAPVDSTTEIPAFDLEEATIDDLQRRLQSGQDTSRSLVEKYLARIEALDKQGPSLRYVVETNPDALAIADKFDVERKAGRMRGPLHGLPVLVKDNIETADRMTTTAGSLALEGWIPPNDSFVAARLRDAGAILLGKANLSEWANFRSTRSTSGWSGRGGLARNPYALDRNPSGSSSGSAGAVAASYCAVAVGTETDGSIVSPANNCSVVGIKPSLGLLSRSGIVPIAHSQDTAGPMARTVRDAAILLGALVGVDPADAMTKDAARKGHTDYTTFLDPNGLSGARIGIPRKALFGYSVAADKLIELSIADMKKLGAVVVDPADITTVNDFGTSEMDVLLYEFKSDLNRYLSRLPANFRVHSLADLIAFNEQHRDREMLYFGQELFERSEKKGPLTDAAYRRARAKDIRLSRTLGIDAVMAKHRLDALVCPTSAPASLTDLVNGDYGSGGSSTVPAIAGYPHITVPAGYAFGLPVGVSFIGRAFSEPTLIRLAFAYEQATKHRRAPRFLATAPL